MSITKTPFGYVNELGQMTDADGNVLARTVVDTAPTPAPVIVNTVTDPSAADRLQARTDAEAMRFTHLKRLFVLVNGVCLAHEYWEQRTRLEEWEQQELADDRGGLMRFKLANGVDLLESIDAPLDDELKAIAARWPHRRVYFGGQEVKA